MKIKGVLQLIDSLNTGGAEVMAVNISNLLVEKNINSHLCTTRAEGKLKENINKKVGYIFLNREKVFDYKAVFKLKKYIKVNNIDVIHAHATSYFFAFLIKLTYPKVKIIWHDHYGLSQRLSERKLFPINYISYFFKSIISVNTKLKIWSEENLHCKKVFFLNNFAQFQNNYKITTLKGLDHKRIICLAAFRAQKDHITLLKAFEIFVKNNPDWTLHLVGKINNDDYSKSVLEYIKTKDLTTNVFTYESCLDIKHILSQATIGVLSSISEGLPISLLEYGLSELPVIVTEVGECPKVVLNKVSGYTVKSKDYINLSEKISNLVDSKSKREEFGKKLNKEVIMNYSKEAFIEKTIKIYNN